MSNQVRSGGRQGERRRAQTPNRRGMLAGFLVGSAVIASAAQAHIPRAHAAPAPEIEYTYDVTVRRAYHFPNNDPVGYGHAICDKVTRGESYGQIMGEVKNDVTPNDEFGVNYLVSNSVNFLCPAQIPQLRQSAAGYQPPEKYLF
jgi:Protein of unknown function (DUF732)